MFPKNFVLSDISIPCLVKAVLRNLWTVIAAMLIFAMSVSLYFSWFHTPVYKGNMTYAVTSRRTSYSSGSNSVSAREVASLLSEMLEANMVRRQIQAYDPALEDFSGTIDASVVANSNFVVITVYDTSPERVFLTLQAINEISPTVTGYVADNSIVQIIRNPAVSASPTNSVNVIRYCALAALTGAACMVLLICFLCIQRETIQTRSGARRMLDTSIIASIPREQSKRTLRSLFKKSDKTLHVFAPTISFAYTEQIHTICTRIEHESATRGSKLFLITGASANEGKSTVAGNVAASLAMMGKKVVILDCDLRNPSLNRFFGNHYQADLPLNQLLSEDLTKDNLLRCIQKHPRLGLYMLCSVNPDRRCTELLAGHTMDQLLQYLRIFDYVILDTPPMGFFVDAEVLSEKVDATMLVVRQDTTPAPDINDCIDSLRSAKATFLGAILNDMTASFTEGYGYGYGYGYGRNGYGYGYGYGYGRYGYGNGSSNKSKNKKK